MKPARIQPLYAENPVTRTLGGTFDKQQPEKISKILHSLKQWLTGTKSVLVSFKYLGNFSRLNKKQGLNWKRLRRNNMVGDSDTSSVSIVSTLLLTALK